MKDLPQSVPELRNALGAIFPSLPRDVGTSGESVFAEAGPTYRSLLREFMYFFEKNIDHFSDRQLRRFAELVAAALASPGPLANAMDACFVKHPREAKPNQRFDAFLATARESAGQ